MDTEHIMKPSCKFLRGFLLFFFAFLSCFTQAQEALPKPIQLNTYLAIDDEEITPETWKQISLVAKGTDSDVEIHLLRPIWWIEQTGAVVGESIHLSMPEMGVNGKAKVLAIVPTKADSRKNTDPNYKAVTGKFIHDNAEVINLYFTHQETEPLGVTPNHLLWSVTHGGWMHAGELKVGHVVKTKTGTETLVKKENKPGRHKVYNLEVHQSHTYYVSNIGVLAHNTKPGLEENSKRDLSQNLADKAHHLSSSKRKGLNTVAVIKHQDGKITIGRNSGNTNQSEIISNALDNARCNAYGGQCAEINALSRAVNKGRSLENATITVSNVRGKTSAKHGTHKPPCETCSDVLDELKVELKND